MASAIAEACDDRVVPRIEILGVPTEYIDHAKVESILARFGLDAAGIADDASAGSSATGRPRLTPCRRAGRASRRSRKPTARFPSDGRSPSAASMVPSRRCAPVRDAFALRPQRGRPGHRCSRSVAGRTPSRRDEARTAGPGPLPLVAPTWR